MRTSELESFRQKQYELQEKISLKEAQLQAIAAETKRRQHRNSHNLEVMYCTFKTS